MYQETITLCGSNGYEKKYYLNEDFESLPQQIKDELKIACVLYTEEIGGILTLEFDEDGKLSFKTTAGENDYFSKIFEKNRRLTKEEDRLITSAIYFRK